MNTEVRQLPDVARSLRVTVDQCRYWLALLGITVSHKGRVRVISEDVFEQLAKVAELVKAGVTPKESVSAIKGAPVEGNVLPVISPVTSSPVGELVNFKGELEEIKKVLMLMAEQNQKLQTEVSFLRKDNNVLRCFLMPPSIITKPVIPWKPEKPENPLEGLSWLRKAYVKVFEPWKMRRYEV